MNFALIMYTHSSYRDVWPLYVGQAEKYMPDVKKYIFVDTTEYGVPEGYTPIVYNDSECYSVRVTRCLAQVLDEWVIFTHEDMPLYEPPLLDSIEAYRQYLEDTGNAFVRLIKCGEVSDLGSDIFGLHEIPRESKHIFAIQPTLWSTAELKKVFSLTPGNSIWEFEGAAQDVCRENDILGFYSYCGERKRGNSHWDSKVFPYVATAIVKGRWNVREYNDELAEMFGEYGIDSSARGYFR